MALKIQVVIPSGTTVSVEVEEPEFYDRVLTLVLRELGVSGGQRVPPGELPQEEPGRLAPKASTDGGKPSENGSGAGGLEAFLDLCRRLEPRGDMRRVVTAAEAARRHLGMEEVSERELGELFDKVGWPRPKLFVQTLRNAARRKFDWLQRVPGRVGYYTVTEKGRQEVVGG